MLLFYRISDVGKSYNAIKLNFNKMCGFPVTHNRDFFVRDASPPSLKVKYKIRRTRPYGKTVEIVKGGS